MNVRERVTVSGALGDGARAAIGPPLSVVYNAYSILRIPLLSRDFHLKMLVELAHIDGKWHAHHVTSVAAGGADTLANAEALCIPCHEQTRSFGG